MITLRDLLHHMNPIKYCSILWYLRKSVSLIIIALVLAPVFTAIQVAATDTQETHFLPDISYRCRIAVNRMPVWNISPEQAGQLLTGDNPATSGMPVVDLRDYHEYTRGHIAGAFCRKPGLPDLSDLTTSLNTTGPVLLYSDARYPGEEISFLESRGFSGVFVIDGGMKAWIQAGKEVEIGE